MTPLRYTYDALGRSTAVPSAARSGERFDLVPDPLVRVTTYSNPLGNTPFQFTYLTNAMRPDYLDYPNTQRVAFSYYGNGTLGSAGNDDRRLSELKNLGVE